jgi:putative flippase GtrA
MRRSDGRYTLLRNITKVVIKNKAEKLRFGLVGIANTTIDFGTLFTLTALGLPPLLSNVFSTTLAFCFSFFANKKYTFRSHGTLVLREIVLFTVITLFGLWGIQTIVIQLITMGLTPTGMSPGIVLFIAKVFATLASLIWNYTLYSRIVFKKKEE